MMSALRFIHTVDGMPVWMWLLTVAVAGYGLLLTWLDPAGADTALGMLLLWQMLCASRGFAPVASAGHFDPLLVRERRSRIAIAHAMHATSAGALAWALVGAAEWLRGSESPLAFEPGRMSAFAFVSAVAWALSLPGPRLVTGSIWIALVFGMAASRFGLDQYAALLQRQEGLAQFAHALAFAFLCPFVMLDAVMPRRETLAIVLFAGAVSAAVAGTLFIMRRDYPLEPSL